ncbi:4687_t:CDS:2 [Diversispora eburnea]|uniref:TBP-associated factor 12 n=1 Tax=Diversispora eburnea TaxID=1213867 RepID=A0A9N8YUU5_9GLOM|nr:4687_t:CDS:2 [Diversispora eburnea]
MLHPQTIQLQQQHHPQSPNSQSPLSHQIQSLPPPSSPRSQQQPPQSPLSHQLQSLPPLSPRSQPPSQPPQTQPPITTNPSGLPSPRLNLINLNKTPGVRTTLMPHLIQNVNTNLPETPVSLSLPESDDGDKQLLSKRKIQQLVDQIDPKERLEPEVEEVTDEFISSVSSFACLLAKHRKSDTLEVKDLQLHLERNWNIRIPGFASDEIRSVKKAVVSSSHQQKLLAVNSAKANKVATTVTSTSQSSLGN